MQSSWSEALAELLQKLLEEKQEAYALNPLNFKVDWRKESKPSLTERYQGLQRVESGFTNLEKYKNMSKEVASSMMSEYDLKRVWSELKGKESAMNDFLKRRLIPKIDAYQSTTNDVRLALFKSADEFGVGFNAKK